MRASVRIRISVFVLLSMAVAGHMIGADTTMKTLLASLKNTYMTADAKAKRDLVIKAIDDGIIKRGMSLEESKALFGRDLQMYRRDSSNGVVKVTVFFETTTPAPKPMMSALRRGWYLDMAFTSDDRLERYSLSNVHK